jgi:glycosyltransferase involved in cell wall biosynthesis
MIRVLMEPHLSELSGESGLVTLIKKYFTYLPQFDIDLVEATASDIDLVAQHAGGTYTYIGNMPLVAHLHGLYWTRENIEQWEYEANAQVIHSIRMARAVTVPSQWVAEPFRRDMHINPLVIPHGIDWAEWQHANDHENYVLYNKNRITDACNPVSVGELAKLLPETEFVTTFANTERSNLHVIGVKPHEKMRQIVQRAAVYLSPIKETFGIGTLEAMASGVPVVGFNYGGNCELIKHGVNGYLAKPHDYADLADGVLYCLANRKRLSENGRELAKQYTWLTVAERLAKLYESVLSTKENLLSVIIPCYNYGSFLERAVESVLAQTYAPDEIIIVDNNSTDDTKVVATRLSRQHAKVRYINCEAQGVAHARNTGIRIATGRYICCLDADDTIEPNFLDVCTEHLHGDSTLGCVYTRMRVIAPDGATAISNWPGKYNFDDFSREQNQVPTCCVFRRDLWARLGGYRQRYAPRGQGCEDAEFFWRMGNAGFRGALATDEALFNYHLGGRTQEEGYQPSAWLSWHKDAPTPFASILTPAKFSHPVRQYDEPQISVVIPCGPGHEKFLPDILDSLEAQSFTQWEVIVVFDTGKTNYADLLTASPFIRPFYANKVGAGAARNLGAKQAKADLLLFVDADDWLAPSALVTMLQAFHTTNEIVYTDYIGHSHIDDLEEIGRLQRAGRLLDYDEKTKRAVVHYKAADYDCQLAIQQPKMQNGTYYIWSLVTSLLPRTWFKALGGFDETMKSWEDWDFWLRAARSGYCFTRIEQPLVHYRFYTGSRREEGGQLHDSLIEYLKKKYEGEKPVCGNCKQTRPSTLLPLMQQSEMQQQFSGDVKIKLNDGNISDHPVVGHVTRRFYNYRQHGEEFAMDPRDAAARPGHYIILQSFVTQPEFLGNTDPSSTLSSVTEAETVLDTVQSFDFTKLSGFPSDKVNALNLAGIFTLDGFLNAPPGILESIFPTKLLKKLQSAAAGEALKTQ